MKKKLKKVKLVSRGSNKEGDSIFKLQMPEESNIFKSCIYDFNPLSRDYDWLVIIDDIPSLLPNKTEVLSCPKENTIFVTSEPTSIARYGKAFVNQFNYLITNQDENVLPHNNARRGHTGNYWLYGKKYEDIISDKPFKKTKKISTICSNKQQGHTNHRKRFEFTKILQSEIQSLDRFGRGFNWIDHKFSALDNYEFHLCIENHISKYVWTEKLADAFLGYTVPIYCGCSNIFDYFPEDSLIQIDINDYKGSLEKIKQIIETPGEYERRLPAVIEARRRVIEEYNLLEMVNNIVENAEESSSITSQKLYSRKFMRLTNFSDFFSFLSFKFNNKFN